MKQSRFLFLLTFLIVVTTNQVAAQKLEKTLLWRISGNNLQQPSYLFGTMHMLCAEDVVLSDSLRSAISRSKAVYLEVDMNNMLELVGAMGKMKMKNDTTLADLYTDAEYEKVKTFFKTKSSLLPFSMLETYKPLLTASTIMEQSMGCSSPISMEQLIMKEASASNKKIRGLETMAYQLSIFDSIPYKYQAQQLLKYVTEYGTDTSDVIKEMTAYYLGQDLDALGTAASKDAELMPRFAELLLDNRNRNWVEKFSKLMPDGSFVFAVGAGHLPGSKGVIQLLRKAGYKVEPVSNKMLKDRGVLL